jgi:hypothetical protein
MNDREPPGYDDWFDEPEPPTLESGRGGRASYDTPAETEEDVWTLPEDEPRRQRRNAMGGEIVLFGVALTKNQIAILAVAALALFIAILAAAGAFSSGAPAVTTITNHPQTTTHQTTTTQTTPTLALPSSASLPLQEGKTGPDVKLLQQALIQLQFLQAPNKADGSFGLATKTAVENFQSANGLTVDGVFGAASLAKLREAIASLGG